MNTFYDYLIWRGDLSFEERPFNEVDNLILAEIIYFEFSDVLAPEIASITLSEAYERYYTLKNAHPYATNNPVPLLELAAKTKRFGNVLISDFEDIIDNDRGIQFAAGTFTLPNNEIYVAFRGTDNTIVGWREDFNQSFLEQSPAQFEATRYLNSALERHKGQLMVGGHSKGGNLSVYSSAFCHEPDRISIIYSNDGPGFNDHIIAQPEYQAILPKVALTIPEDSIVGILFTNKEEKKVIQSTESFGGKQHSPYTWGIECDHFLLADGQSDSSTKLDETLTRWLAELDNSQKQNIVNVIFDSLDASGASTLAEMEANKFESYNAIFKALKELNTDSKEDFKESIKKLIMAGKDTFKEENKADNKKKRGAL